MTTDPECTGAGARTDTEGPQFIEFWDADVQSTDPLSFPGYHVPAPDEESVRAGLLRIGGELVVGVDIDFSRGAGTMGVVAGERIVRAYDRASERGLHVVQFVSSGGARLQEGMFALVQMARTASALHRHRSRGLLSLAVLRSPTTGGVYASWASLADLRAAERGAVIGFGGPRVVEQVTGSLPGNESHSAESAYANGIVDALLGREDEEAWLAAALGSSPAASLTIPAERRRSLDAGAVPADTWDVVRRCRAVGRPSGADWAVWLTDSWVELKGSDPSIRAGLATVDGRRVVVVAMDRHAGGDEQLLPGPGAFRLAQRAVALADRISLPLLTIVDTPGADPSPLSESAGIAGEIARTLLAMSELRTESVCLVVGEGGSGGAMALAHCDTLLMLEGSIFSVISPESGAAVLYRDAGMAPKLARDFHMSARELHRAGLVDDVVAENVEDVRKSVSKALADVVHGNRNTRIDAVTRQATGRIGGNDEK